MEIRLPIDEVPKLADFQGRVEIKVKSVGKETVVLDIPDFEIGNGNRADKTLREMSKRQYFEPEEEEDEGDDF